MDEDLKKFRNVKLLILSGNYIEDVPGVVLPRKMQYLELFSNNISDLTNLSKGAPNGMVHLGMGRNKLRNGQSIRSCLFNLTHIQYFPF